MCNWYKVLKKERPGHEYYSVEREVWCGIREENHDNVKKPTTILVKTIETNSRFTTKIDISSHMESLNFQSGNDETA